MNRRTKNLTLLIAIGFVATVGIAITGIHWLVQSETTWERVPAHIDPTSLSESDVYVDPVSGAVFTKQGPEIRFPVRGVVGLAAIAGGLGLFLAIALVFFIVHNREQTKVLTADDDDLVSHLWSIQERLDDRLTNIETIMIGTSKFKSNDDY